MRGKKRPWPFKPDEADSTEISASQAKGHELRAAKAAARERYTLISELLKAEAGITRHYQHKQLSGLALISQGRRILAPSGVTRRQLYVLAHECGHIVLHSSPTGMAKPGHVKEFEAEVYAHRAFQRYDLEVPPSSSSWAREYVGQWIKMDQSEGKPICNEAVAFAAGRRSPHDPLPSIDAQPPRDFSNSIERFIEKGTRVAEQQEALLSASDPERQVATLRPVQTVYVTADEPRRIERNPDDLPIACGTCQYKGMEQCRVHLETLSIAWQYSCKHGHSWRPRRKFILTRIADALVKRIAGRAR